MLRIEINNPNLILDDMPTNWGEGVFPLPCPKKNLHESCNYVNLF